MSRFIKVGAKGEQLAASAKKWVAVIDTKLGLMFSAADIGDAQDHASAEKAVAELKLAGFSDWRLPAVEELFLLADRTRSRPAIDTDFFPSCKSALYWTASSWAPSPAGYAWVVSFYYGDAYGCSRRNYARVRAVRSLGSGQ